MIHAVIIEDEPFAANALKRALQRDHPDVQVLTVLPSIEESREWLADETTILPDVFFMDIQLADGLSFELFDVIPQHIPVIFTTAYDEYAVQAFKVNSLDYLLKPIDPSDLAAAIQKFRDRHPHELLDMKHSVRNLFQDWQTQHIRYKERFLVPYAQGLVPLSVDDIACFIKEELIYVITRKNNRYLVDYKAMDEIERLLNPAQFYRANRQCLVHIDMVGKIKTNYKGLLVSLKAPVQIEFQISQEKAPSFKNWLMG
jgi:DNA-binding LytR/AlgR family response regulator